MAKIVTKNTLIYYLTYYFFNVNTKLINPIRAIRKAVDLLYF